MERPCGRRRSGRCGTSRKWRGGVELRARAVPLDARLVHLAVAVLVEIGAAREAALVPLALSPAMLT